MLQFYEDKPPYDTLRGKLSYKKYHKEGDEQIRKNKEHGYHISRLGEIHDSERSAHLHPAIRRLGRSLSRMHQRAADYRFDAGNAFYKGNPDRAKHHIAKAETVEARLAKFYGRAGNLHRMKR